MNTAFAPLFTAYAVGHDAETQRLVDDFLQNIPADLIGRIRLCCLNKDEEYLAADRWMSVYMFLASRWQGHFQYTLEIGGTQVDIAPLRQIKPPTTYSLAVAVGEEGYEVLRRQRADSLVFEAQRAQMAHGSED